MEVESNINNESEGMEIDKYSASLIKRLQEIEKAIGTNSTKRSRSLTKLTLILAELWLHFLDMAGVAIQREVH